MTCSTSRSRRGGRSTSTAPDRPAVEPEAAFKAFGLEAYLYSGAAHLLNETPLDYLAPALHAMRKVHGPSDSGADRLAEIARDVLLKNLMRILKPR